MTISRWLLSETFTPVCKQTRGERRRYTDDKRRRGLRFWRFVACFKPLYFYTSFACNSLLLDERRRGGKCFIIFFRKFVQLTLVSTGFCGDRKAVLSFSAAGDKQSNWLVFRYSISFCRWLNFVLSSKGNLVIFDPSSQFPSHACDA